MLARRRCSRLAGLLTLLLVPGCAAKPGGAPDEGDDPFKGRSTDQLAEGGRWIPPEDVRRIGEAQTGTYESAPYWDPSACSGRLLSGTAALGDHLTATFSGAHRYDGYNCRRNTADTSRMSVHGTGRALDIYVPLAGGDADNSLGDPIAHWLIEHATEIGVQLIIWDRTKWNISYSGRKDREYGGTHPHHDHLHIELTSAGATGATPWFRGAGMEAPPAEAPPPAGETIDPACNDTCPYARDGECDDGSLGGAVYCELGSDCSDCRGGAPAETGGTGGTATGLPHAGLTLDDMVIPYRGLANSTLAGTGMGDTEPYGERVSYAGGEFVRGTISHFGGPSDTGVSSTETGAITGERLRSLNSPEGASASTIASRPSDFYFVAMRWRYSPRGSSWLRNARVLVVAPDSGRAVVLRPVDWGPNTRTARIVDVSPQAIADLGVSTDADVLVSWAPAGTPLGVVGTSSGTGGTGTGGTGTGGTGTGTGSGTEGCTNTCRWAGDGACDDGGPGASFSVCALGTDCDDCGARTGGTTGTTPEPTPTPTSPPPSSSLCTNTCIYAGDGECDDGGPGSDYALCALGSDCDDCGSRSGGSTGSTGGTAGIGGSCTSASSCSGSLDCRAGVSDPSLHCCVAGYGTCSSGSDCCGYMDCVSGQCEPRDAGRACLAGGDCASGYCSGGRCG
ncbi:MAG: hypothetical protein H6719_20485 [Sandaracinaceae bacterium]|nr:hypothetical protein [Sandaracinaceae bacterium]